MKKKNLLTKEDIELVGDAMNLARAQEDEYEDIPEDAEPMPEDEEEQPEEEQPEEEDEEEEDIPDIDPEVQKTIKYYLRRIKKMDRADVITLFGMTLSYFLSRKPKLLPGLAKKFKRMGIE